MVFSRFAIWNGWRLGGDTFGEETDEARLRGLWDGVRGEPDGAFLSGVQDEADAGECEGCAALHCVWQGIRWGTAIIVLPGMPRAEAAGELPPPHGTEARGDGDADRQDGSAVRGLRQAVRRDGRRTEVLSGLCKRGIQRIGSPAEQGMGRA